MMIFCTAFALFIPGYTFAGRMKKGMMEKYAVLSSKLNWIKFPCGINIVFYSIV